MSIRLFLVPACLAAFACVAAVCASAGTVGAKGNDLAIYPSAGGIDTQIDVSSEVFAPDVEVTFEVAFVSRIDEQPAAYSGPLAVQRANGSGRNEVQIYLRDGPGIATPTEPSFVLFRATSAGADARVAQGMFVFTVDGRRPSGSGEVRLSVSAAGGATPHDAIFWWRRAGSDDEFYTPYAGSFSLPLQVTIPWLDDGEWEVLALGGSDTVAVGDGRIDVVSAGYCFLNLPLCGAAIGPLRVKRVTIRDAQPVDVTILLGDPLSLPVTGSSSLISHEVGRGWITVTTSLLGLLLLLTGLRIRRAGDDT